MINRKPWFLFVFVAGLWVVQRLRLNEAQQVTVNIFFLILGQLCANWDPVFHRELPLDPRFMQ